WVAPLNQVRYWIQVVDTSGCVAEDNLLVRLVTDVPIFLGNAFSPNGDGTNDVFYIFADDGVEEVETFRIFDRWGNKVFQADRFAPNNPDYGWDGNFQGQALNPAVFVWWAEIRLKNGESLILKGDVMLIR
ncbi:MAG: gliding motility-associated C-terminal domain-containing protein, partial [Phaeodactylibacter sp.]|nr:gliding motility-associated C-terminal domain-containing protein [Phaeodactylibacter sp.]